MDPATIGLIIKAVGELVTRIVSDPDGISEAEVNQEIGKIRQWAKDAEARERALFPSG